MVSFGQLRVFSSHVLVVEGIVDHYGGLDHGAAERADPALLFLVGFRVEVERDSGDLEFLHRRQSVSRAGAESDLRS